MKQKRNDQCLCGSGKKFKHCCVNFDALKTNETSTEKIAECMEIFAKNHPKHKVIDITDALNLETYNKFQIMHYSSPVIMFAERTDNNEAVFATRSQNSDSNIMMLYHGNYRTFDFDAMGDYLTSLDNVILTA